MTSMRTRPAPRARRAQLARDPAAASGERRSREVEHDLVHALGVAVARWRRRARPRTRQRDAGPAHAAAPRAATSARAPRRRRTAAARSGDGPALEPRQVEQLVDQPPEALDLAAASSRSVSGSAGSTPSTRFSSTACSALIGVRSSCDDVGDEVAPHAVDLGQLGGHRVEGAGQLARPRRASRAVTRRPCVAARHRRGGGGHLPQRRGHARARAPAPARARRASRRARSGPTGSADPARRPSASDRADGDAATMTSPSFSLIDGSRSSGLTRSPPRSNA